MLTPGSAGLPRGALRPVIAKRRPGLLLREIGNVFDYLPSLGTAWQAISSSIISRTGKNGEESFWTAQDIRAAFDESTAEGRRDYRNASAIITGVGLLATFLAILVALLDVRLAQNRIQGLDLLVQGLSGKFLSSVVAVARATALVVLEGTLRPGAGARPRPCRDFEKPLAKVSSLPVLLTAMKRSWTSWRR